MRRWKLDVGSRSSRAPAFTVLIMMQSPAVLIVVVAPAGQPMPVRFGAVMLGDTAARPRYVIQWLDR
jgi:hypothetical protein